MKNIKLKFIFFITIIGLSQTTVFAQEYKYEIGGMAGTSFYMGDANKTKLYQKPGLSAGAVFRYNRNFRWAYKFNLAMGSVSGDTKNSGNVFPHNEHASFKRTFYDVGGQIEYNFFNYSDKYPYLGTKKISPYVFTGIGLTLASGDNFFAGLNLPLGVGVKYKLRDRLNIGFEFSVRKLFGDDFDKPNNDNNLSLEDPYHIKSSFLKNKDWYCLTMISITWDFGLRTRSCLNLD